MAVADIQHGKIAHEGAPGAVSSHYWRISSWRRAVMLSAVSLLYAAVLAWGVAAALMPPRLALDLGTTAAGATRIEWLLPGGNLWDAGARPGDLVLRLNDRAPVRYESGNWTGRDIAVTRPDGHVLSASASNLGHLSQAWPLLALSPWFFLFGVLLLLRARPLAAGMTSFALFGLAALALALGPVADANRTVFGEIAERAVMPLFGASFVYFFLAFPFMQRVRPRVEAAMLLPALLVSAFSALGTVVPDLYPPAHSVWLALLVLYLGLGVTLATRTFITLNDRIARRGLRIIAVSTAVSVMPFLVLSVVPLILSRPAIVSPEHAVLALAVLPAGFAYAILRYETLQAQLVQRWLVRAVLWAVTAGACGLVTAGLCQVLGATPLSGRGVVIVAGVLVLAAGLTGPLLMGPVQRAVDRIAFKDRYEYRVSLQDLSRRLSLAAGLDALVDSLPATLQRLMNLEYVSLLVQDRGRLRPLGSAGTAPPGLGVAAVSVLSARLEPGRLISLHVDNHLIMVAPLQTQNVAVGCLCLGPKRSGEPFRIEDEALLLTLSGHLAATIRNAQLTDELRAQVCTLDALQVRLERAQEEERARLAAEIHDEPLQLLLLLRRQLGIVGDICPLDSDRIALFDTVIGQLRAVCQEVRPAAPTWGVAMTFSWESKGLAPGGFLS